MHVWALGLSCETPAAPPDRAAGARTRQPENSKRAHFTAPALQTPPKFHERTPRERKKKENCGGKREKKRENFGPPTLRGSTLRGSTLRGSTLRGPNLRGPNLLPLFLGLGLHPRGLHPLGAPPFVVQKFNIQKLTEVEIGRSRIGRTRKKKAGRSRNWPKSIALENP